MRVLATLFGETDICSGYVANTRLEEEGSEFIKGLFLNTLPIRLDLNKCHTWKELISVLYELELDALKYRLYPLVNILKDKKVDQLFQVVFSFVQFHVYEELNNDSDSIKSLEVYERTNYDLMINFYGAHKLKPAHFDIDFNPLYFTKKQIIELAECYQQAIHAVIMNVNDDNQIELLPKYTLLEQIAQFGRKQILYDHGNTVVDLFEKVVVLYPNAVALICDEKSVTYQELVAMVDMYALGLLKKGMKHQQPICLHMERSIESVACILAILKLGAVYCPLDPCHPKARCQTVLSLLDEPIILTNQNGKGKLADLGYSILILEDIAHNNNNTSDLKKFLPSCSDLAYIMFTSGSTGLPKGVRSNINL